MLAKEFRVTDPKDFSRVFDTGRKVFTPELMVVVAPGATDRTRFGFIVSKKVGNSVVRHRTVRVLREFFREFAVDSGAVDVVVVARPSIVDGMSKQTLRKLRAAGFGKTS